MTERDDNVWMKDAGWQPRWFADAAAAKGKESIFEAPDGTFVVWPLRSEDHRPIFGLPTRAVAELVVAELEAAFDAGYGCGANSVS